MMGRTLFVVGLSRSGTKFLMNVLRQHPDIAMCSETHFFSSLIHNGVVTKTRHLFPLDSSSKLDELRRILETGQTFGHFWKNPKAVNFDELMVQFGDSNRTHKDLFELLIRQFAKEQGKTIAGEKTTSHLFHVDTLIDWFPNCRVIHIIRNPMAILASEINKEFKPDYPLRKSNPLYSLGLLMWVLVGWRLAVHKHKEYKKKYPEHYMLIRFEDLCLKHEEIVKRVAEFAKVEYHESMLNPPVVNSSFVREQDHRPLDGWKKKLPSRYTFLLRLFLKRNLREFGY